MMPPTDRIREQNEQDPGRVTHTRQEAGPNDFLAVDPALRSLHLNVEGLGSQAFYHPGHSRETQCRPHLPSCRHSAQQQTHHSGMRQVSDGTNRQTYRCPTVSQTLPGPHAVSGFDASSLSRQGSYLSTFWCFCIFVH